MKGLSCREKWICAAATFAVVAGIAYSAEKTIVHGVFSWEVTQPEYARMVVEMAVLFLLFVLIGRLAGSSRRAMVGMGVVMAAFLYVHVILLPILVSGLYLVYVCMAGAQVRVWLDRLGRRMSGKPGRKMSEGGILREGDDIAGNAGKTRPDGATGNAGKTHPDDATGNAGKTRPDDVGRDFLVGCMAVICLFCLMSALGIGSIPNMWVAVFLTAAGLLLIQIRGKQPLYPLRLFREAEAAVCSKTSHEMPAVLGTALVLSMFCLQAGRMNISIDYDTMWYGARAAYVLNNGRGIYEDLGMISVVYTYSKGWETLTLPLAVLPSYSFLISVNWWLAVGVIWVAYRMARAMMSRRSAALLAIFLSTVPAIMNMAVTAKTDIATLLVQLLMLKEFLGIVAMGDCHMPEAKGQACLAFCYGLAAFLLSLSMKPTALIFSTAVCGMSVVCLLYARKSPFRFPCRYAWEAAVVGILSLGELFAIWVRTWLITGIPVTSVFSTFFIRLGFHIKYPYVAKAVPNNGAGIGLRDKLIHIAGRLYGLFLNPNASEDMSHVIIAWGGLLLWFAIWIAALWFLLDKHLRGSRERRMDGWLAAVVLPFIIVNLTSLYLLQNVDGNYFQLLYVLLALAVFRLLARLKNANVRKLFLCLSVPVMAFSVVFTSLSNWAWSLGLTPANLINRGYYDHKELRHAQMVAEGKGVIWDILAQNPRNRLIVIGNHPQDLAFPCSAQSYVDITGSDGNVKLVAHIADFVDFMEYAKTDYVYMNGTWTGDRQRAWEVVYWLIEYGYLEPIHYEGDNMLAEVHLDGVETDETHAQSKMFLDWQSACTEKLSMEGEG